MSTAAISESLLAEMRLALAADVPAQSRPIPDALLVEMKEALLKDEQRLGRPDIELAAMMRSLIPRLTQDALDSAAQVRAQLSAVAPWTLVALGSQLDLLSPIGKQRHEPTHTQILSFLLDPSKPHGLGTKVLRSFLRLLRREGRTDDVFERLTRDTPDSTSAIQRMQVKAEAEFQLGDRSGRCDIWLELDQGDRLVVIVVENKIDAGEHGDQLGAYESAIFQSIQRRARQLRHTGFDYRLVLLSPAGRPPQERVDKEVWTTMTYLSLAAALANAGRDLPEIAAAYLNLYIATLLHCVLEIPARPVGIQHMLQLPFLQELQRQGALP